MSFERTTYYNYEMLRNYNQPGSFNAAPWPTPRTPYDQSLQNMWDTTSVHPIPPFHPHPSPYGNQPRRGGTNHLMDTPYQPCGNTHSSGPASTSSTQEPMQMPMGANPDNNYPLIKGDCYWQGTDNMGITNCNPNSTCNATSGCSNGHNCGVYDPDNGSPYCGMACPY